MTTTTASPTGAASQAQAMQAVATLYHRYFTGLILTVVTRPGRDDAADPVARRRCRELRLVVGNRCRCRGYRLRVGERQRDEMGYARDRHAQRTSMPTSRPHPCHPLPHVLVVQPSQTG